MYYNVDIFFSDSPQINIVPKKPNSAKQQLNLLSSIKPKTADELSKIKTVACVIFDNYERKKTSFLGKVKDFYSNLCEKIFKCRNTRAIQWDFIKYLYSQIISLKVQSSKVNFPVPSKLEAIAKNEKPALLNNLSSTSNSNLSLNLDPKYNFNREQSNSTLFKTKPSFDFTRQNNSQKAILNSKSSRDDTSKTVFVDNNIEISGKFISNQTLNIGSDTTIDFSNPRDIKISSNKKSQQVNKKNSS